MPKRPAPFFVLFVILLIVSIVGVVFKTNPNLLTSLQQPKDQEFPDLKFHAVADRYYDKDNNLYFVAISSNKLPDPKDELKDILYTYQMAVKRLPKLDCVPTYEAGDECRPGGVMIYRVTVSKPVLTPEGRHAFYIIDNKRVLALDQYQIQALLNNQPSTLEELELFHSVVNLMTGGRGGDIFASNNPFFLGFTKR